MRFRKLRIAWSVACGVAIVPLIVLWVRSNERCDYVQTTTFGLQRLNLSSSDSHISGAFYFGEGDEFSDAIGSDRLNKLPSGVKSSPWALGRSPGSSTGMPRTSTQYFFAVPHWFAVVAVLLLSFIPWMPTQFSLRTLLIATTLTAALLGVVAISK